MTMDAEVVTAFELALGGFSEREANAVMTYVRQREHEAVAAERKACRKDVRAVIDAAVEGQPAYVEGALAYVSVQIGERIAKRAAKEQASASAD